MDNLSTHKSRTARAEFSEGFEPLYLAPYSCELNPIETLWALVKRKWRAKLIENPSIDLTTQEGKKLIKELFNKIKQA